MNASDLYASKYLNATDVKNGNIKTKVQSVSASEIGGQGSAKKVKLVIQFTDVKKPMILNKTNATFMIGKYGEDTDSWKDKDVSIVKSFAMFNGNLVESLRLE